MPYPNEHAARVTDPDEFERVRDITKAMKEEKNWDIPAGVRCLGGPTKGGDFKVQAWRFDREKWSAARAKKWLKDNEHKYMTFEEATGEKSELWGKDYRHEMLPHPTELRAKEDEEGNGWIEGYASVWDVVDQQNERVRRGAFKKTILERVNTGKVVLMIRHIIHGGSVPEIIGKITEAIEDDYGLWIRATLFDTELAQDFRTIVADEGVEVGLSIGYAPVEWKDVMEDGQEIKDLLEVKLYEITGTLTPALEEAFVTAAKSRGAAPPKQPAGAPSEKDKGREHPPETIIVEAFPLASKRVWLALEKAKMKG